MLYRVSPLTPTRCNPVALELKPRESVSNLGPTGQISYFDCIECKVRGSAVRALDLAKLAGSASVLVRVFPPTPTMCNFVALGFKPRKSVSNVGPPGQISCLYRIETKDRGSAVRALNLGPTSGKYQCAPQGVPTNTN